MSLRPTLDFLVYDWVQAEQLTSRSRLADHSRETFDENIVHLVLAKIPGPDGKLVPGTRGISLFIVPRKLVDTDGQLTGVRNDVAPAGLNHKLGWRGTTNTLLNFGEGKFPVDGEVGAVGYRVGRPHEGLRCMRAARYFFHYELPRIGAWLGVVSSRDPTCADMPEEAF